MEPVPRPPLTPTVVQQHLLLFFDAQHQQRDGANLQHQQRSSPTADKGGKDTTNPTKAGL